ncbi:Glutathione S-transferase 1, isoform D [Halotydeus destructor]|nr:Glutathione S-transferase 1, isoform D [Halotydeus destructor]
MPLDFYCSPMGSPTRAILMLGWELDILDEINIKVVDMMKKEHLTEEFIKLNPQHCIPTLHDTDAGLVITESRVIMTYLVDKLAEDHPLYPKELAKRILIDKFLYFDLGCIYATQSPFLYPQMMAGQAPDAEKEKAYKDKLAVLDVYLEGNDYITGTEMTLADLSIYATLTTNQFIDYDISEFKNVSAFFSRMSNRLPCDKQVNQDAIVKVKEFLAAKRAQ